MRIELDLMLLHRHLKRAVNPGLIASLNSFKEALLLCKSLSMLDDQTIAEKMNMELSNFIAIWSGDGYFPMDRLIEYMRICENIVPLLWLALRCGYNLRPLEEELEQETRLLKEEIEQRTEELKVMKEEVIAELAERIAASGNEGADRMVKIFAEVRGLNG